MFLGTMDSSYAWEGREGSGVRDGEGCSSGNFLLPPETVQASSTCLQKEPPWPTHMASAANVHTFPPCAVVDKTFTNLVREKCGHLYCCIVKLDISAAIGAHESQKEAEIQMDINVH